MPAQMGATCIKEILCAVCRIGSNKSGAMDNNRRQVLSAGIALTVGVLA
jgi:hypothetical protein